MEIDLTKLLTKQTDVIEINIDVNFNEDYLKKSSIRKLQNVKFIGSITELYDGKFQISGNLTGTMVLPDDITLEDVNYDFKIEINEKFSEFDNNLDNNLKIIKNNLDISSFLWQNILVEIPLKAINEKNKNVSLKGNGWRLITEEQLNNNSDNSPFAELASKFNSRKE